MKGWPGAITVNTGVWQMHDSKTSHCRGQDRESWADIIIGHPVDSKYTEFVRNRTWNRLSSCKEDGFDCSESDFLPGWYVWRKISGGFCFGWVLTINVIGLCVIMASCLEGVFTNARRPTETQRVDRIFWLFRLLVVLLATGRVSLVGRDFLRQNDVELVRERESRHLPPLRLPYCSAYRLYCIRKKKSAKKESVWTIEPVERSIASNPFLLNTIFSDHMLM